MSDFQLPPGQQPQQQPQNPPPGGYPLPQQGQFQPPKKQGIPGWLIAVLVGVAGLVLVCIIGAVAVVGALTMMGNRVSSVFETIESTTVAISAEPAAPVSTSGALGIGDQGSAGDLQIQVLGVNPVSAGENEVFTPGDGNEYLAVQIVFENTGSESVNLNAFSTGVQDDSENTYDYSVGGASLATEQTLDMFTAIEPGAAAEGVLVYEVPQDATELFWVYADPTSGDNVVVKIK